MKSFGASLLFLCLAIMAVDIIGYRSMLLSSLYDLGVDVAWCIIAAIIVPGSVLFMFGDELGRKSSEPAVE
jgi:hypothetical protein